MRARSLLVLVAVLQFAVSTPLVALQLRTTAEPPPQLIGTWRLNVAKSKFESPGREQSETRTYQVSGDRITMKSSSKNAAGKTMSFSYSATLDGKWSPMHGNPNADSISVTAVSGREIKASARLHGKASAESTAEVSADGKHLTLTRKMVGLKGAPTDVLAFDR